MMAEKFIPYAELDEEQRALVNSENRWERRDAASRGYGLDKLVDDPDEQVREAVAKEAYGLDKLVEDKNGYVRAAVAEQGWGLDKLAGDESWRVRRAVANQGYGLDKLVDDQDWRVRKAVAEQGYGLEVLVEDENEHVRVVVAEQGYGLEKLVDDRSELVREAVAEQGYALDKLVNDPDAWVREGVASQGYGLDKLFDDPNEDVRETALQSLDFRPERVAQEWAAANPDKCALEENRLRGEKGVSGLAGVGKDALVMEVPDGYLVAEKSGVVEEYPGIRLMFCSREGEIMSDIALVEHTATDRDFSEPTYVLRAWKFGEECCMEDAVVGFNARDIAAFGAKIDAAKAPAAREPKELKAAGDKPRQPEAEKATPAADGRACSASAAARGAEGRAPEVRRQK